MFQYVFSIHAIGTDSDGLRVEEVFFFFTMTEDQEANLEAFYLGARDMGVSKVRRLNYHQVAALPNPMPFK